MCIITPWQGLYFSYFATGRKADSCRTRSRRSTRSGRYSYERFPTSCPWTGSSRPYGRSGFSIRAPASIVFSRISGIVAGGTAVDETYYCVEQQNNNVVIYCRAECYIAMADITVLRLKSLVLRLVYIVISINAINRQNDNNNVLLVGTSNYATVRCCITHSVPGRAESVFYRLPGIEVLYFSNYLVSHFHRGQPAIDAPPQILTYSYRD